MKRVFAFAVVAAILLSVVFGKAQDGDVDESIVVSSTGDHRVDRFTSHAPIAFIDDETIPGTPQGLAFGPADGNLYVGDSTVNGTIRVLSGINLDLLALVPPGGGNSGSLGLTFGPDGNLYAASFFTNSIRRYDGVTGNSMGDFVTPGSGGLAGPLDLTFGRDQRLYVSTVSSVLRYDGGTGAFIDSFVSSGSGGLNRARGLRFGPDGNLFVASEFTGNILRYNGVTGAFLNTFVPAGTGGLNRPFAMAWGSDRNLYVTNSTVNDAKVLRYGQTGAFIDAFIHSGIGDLHGPTFLAFDDGPHFWIGLRNSDDQGTAFDLKTEVFVDGVFERTGVTRCISNLTRDPAKAREVSSPVSTGLLNAGPGSIISLKLSTRIGTNGVGSRCVKPGVSHASATGVRVYFDSANRASHTQLQVNSNSPVLYLHADGGTCGSPEVPGFPNRFMNNTAPTGTTWRCKDSGGVAFVAGNPWKEIGTWSETLP